MKKDLDVDAECIAGLTQYATLQCVTVWYVIVRDCTVRNGMLRYGTLRPILYGLLPMVWYCMLWYVTLWYITICYGTVSLQKCHGTVRNGMVWYNTLRYGMLQKCYGTVCCGT